MIPPDEPPVRIIERIIYVPPVEQITEPVPVTVVVPPNERSEQIYVHAPPGTRETKTRPEMERRGGDSGQKTVTEPDKNCSPQPAQTIHPGDRNNSETIPNNSPTELFEPAKPTPQADVPELEKIGPGRQRRYEELGLNDVESVREVVLFRHEFGFHMPGLSRDTEEYYEHFYFTRPKKGEKFYDRHVKCWQRRTKWITATST